MNPEFISQSEVDKSDAFHETTKPSDFSKYQSQVSFEMFEKHWDFLRFNKIMLGWLNYTNMFWKLDIKEIELIVYVAILYEINILKMY